MVKIKSNQILRRFENDKIKQKNFGENNYKTPQLFAIRFVVQDGHLMDTNPMGTYYKLLGIMHFQLLAVFDLTQMYTENYGKCYCDSSLEWLFLRNNCGFCLSL